MLQYDLIVFQISTQFIKAHMSGYGNFKMCCEKKKNTEKIRQTLKAHILGTAWWIHPKFRITGTHPKGIYTEKMCVSILGVSSYRCMKATFSLFLQNT